MIVAAHQPLYLPWLGFFAKMASADLFVVMDDLQYESQNFQNRNRVKMNNGAGWLTVPLERGSRSDRILDKRIRNQATGTKHHWQRRAWSTLRIHYGRAPYYAYYAGELEDVYTRPWDRLVDLDLHLLHLVRRWLGISVPIIRSSQLGLRGRKTERILDLCHTVGATVYLSGRGASTGYLDVDRLRDAGVEVAWQAFEHPVYPQRYPALGFVPNLCVLDLLFNCGPASRELLLEAAAPPREQVAAP